MGENRGPGILARLSDQIRQFGIKQWFMIGLCGVALVIISMPMKSEQKNQEEDMGVRKENVEKNTETIQYYETHLESQLESLLGEMQGVGKVRVMITLEDLGEEIALYQTPYSKNNVRENDETGEQRLEEQYEYREEVIYEKNGNGTEVPYIVRNRQPQIRGVAVICQGGNQPELVLKITSLIEALFHIEAHKISISGMK